MTINLGKEYDIKGIKGDTVHAILCALADAERMYKKSGMTGMAENAAQAYQIILVQAEMNPK